MFSVKSPHVGVVASQFAGEKLARTSLQLVWHAVRYIVATSVSTVISGIIPFVIASLPLVLAIVWVLAWVAAFLLYILTGEVIDVEMGDPIGLVLVPLMLSIMGVVSITAVILVVTVFNLFIIFPVALVTEIISLQIGVHRWSLRLGIFLSVGILLGTIVGVAGVLLITGQQGEVSLSEQVGIGALLAVICICTEFVFGMTLMLMDLARKGLVVVSRKWKNLRERRKLPQPA